MCVTSSFTWLKRKFPNKAIICDIKLVLQEGTFPIYYCSRFQAAETVNSIAVTIKDEHSSMKDEHSFVKAEQRLNKDQKKRWTNKILNIVFWRINIVLSSLNKGWTKPLSINWKYYNRISNWTGLNTTKRRKVRSKSIWQLPVVVAASCLTAWICLIG